MSHNQTTRKATPSLNGSSHIEDGLPGASPFECTEDEISATDEALRHLMRRLGIEAPLSYHTRLLPLERLIIPGEKLVKGSAGQFQTNITLVGVLHAPLVVLEEGEGIDDPRATFRVIAGRRRVAGACRAGLTWIECRVYDALSPQMRALIILSENMHRSPAWVEELKALVELIGERVGMTDVEIAKAIGVPVSRVREQLKLAQLPLPVLSQIFAGKMSLTTARQITRLSKSQQAFLASLAEVGQDITPELVEQTLRGQISKGLAPLQEVLAQSWEMPVYEINHSQSDQPSSLPEQGAALPPATTQTPLQETAVPEAGITIAQFLSALTVFEQQLQPGQETARVHMLIQALKQEVELFQRKQTQMTTTV